MNRLTKGLVVRPMKARSTVGLGVLAVSAGLVMASPAAAANPACGATITSSTTLTGDVGPCTGDGLRVKADNITLDLNHHRVFQTENGPAENVGVTVDGSSRVTVTNGTVSGFDAGVLVDGGSKNHVSHMTVRNNINDNIFLENDPQTDCIYGDGILVQDSSANIVEGNRAIHNGPYDGITMVGDSNRNRVRDNVVMNQTVPNYVRGTHDNGTCGPFGAGSRVGRTMQDIGIRIEGPGADDNRVSHNDISNSAIGGITIHGFVFNSPMGAPPEPQNTGNEIANNYVADTGKDTHTIDTVADGIGVLRQGPGAIVGVSQGNEISHNTVVRSFRHGIFLGDPRCGMFGDPATIVCQPGPYTGTVVRGNTITGSADDGIRVAGPPPVLPGNPDLGNPGSVNNRLIGNVAHDNGDNLPAVFFPGDPPSVLPLETAPFGHDGHDGNVGCDNNLWSMNEFEFVNQPCVDPSATVR